MSHARKKKEPGKAKRHAKVKKGDLLATDEENYNNDWMNSDMALATRKFKAEELGVHPDDMDEDEEEWGKMDVEDNLTYHEDTLSVMKGLISNSKGEDIPVWVTTDSGSMTQLIQADYARKLKLHVKEMNGEQCFNIASPGGGRKLITQYVYLPFRIIAKKESIAGQPYGENESIEEEIAVPTKFGLCDSLPVPILWGGKQMRGHKLLDYHHNKVLSLIVEGQRFMMQSKSWLVAVSEMALLEETKLKRCTNLFVRIVKD